MQKIKTYFTFDEMNPHGYQLTNEVHDNISTLIERMSAVRLSYGKPMLVTSGLRSAVLQAQLIEDGISKAVKSKHLIGAACDIADPDGELGKWCLKNRHLLEALQLWCEDPAYTVRKDKDGKVLSRWLHAQIFPPASGKRFFKP